MVYEELIEDNEKIIVLNFVESLYFVVELEWGDELKKIIDDVIYKYMIGDIIESQFDKEVEKWEISGGK